MKQFWIDLETTGTDPKKHGIWQFAGKIIIDGETVETIYENIRPFASDALDPDALEMNSLTKEKLFSFDKTPQAFYRELITAMERFVDKYDKTDKFTFVGYNVVAFDDPMLREFFKKNGDVYYGSWFFWPGRDIAVLAADVIGEDRGKMKNFKQSTVAKYFGIQVDDEKLHDGLYDIKICQKIDQVIRESKP